MYLVLEFVGEAGGRRQLRRVVVFARCFCDALCAVSLALLVSRVYAAHDVQAALPADEVAVIADLADTRLHLHGAVRGEGRAEAEHTHEQQLGDDERALCSARESSQRARRDKSAGCDRDG